MIPRTIVAQPDDLAARPTPDIIPLPGRHRPETEDRPPSAVMSKPAAPNAPELGARDFLNALRYHSVLFVTLGGLVATGLGATAWTLVPPKYTTYATLFIDQRDPKNVPVGVMSNEGDNFTIYFKTIANLATNRATINGALMDSRNGIAQLPMLRNEEDPTAFLEQKLLIDLTDTSTSAMRVSMAGDDPKQITQIVNGVVEYFMKELETWRGEKGQRIARLEKSRNDLQQQLNGKLKHMQGLIAGDTTKGETFKQKLRMSEYVDALRQRAAARAGLANAQGILKARQTKVEQHDANPPPMPVDDLTPAIDRSPEVQYKEMIVSRLGRELSAIRSQSANLAGTKYYEIEARYRTEKASLDALRPKIKAKIEADYRSAIRLGLVADVEKAQDEVRRLEALAQTTEGQVAEFKEFKDLDESDNAKLVERIPEDDAIARYRAQISDIDRAVIHLRADLDAPSRVRIWHKAEEPTKKDIRKQAAISGAAGLFGLGLVGGLISVYELRRKRVYGPGDPVFKHKVPLLGCLPDCVAPASAKADAVDPAGRAFFDAVDKVKAVLCRQLQRRRMQAVLVTSAAPGEGKSALAWHLALSLARSDRRTLFVDGNLRNPGLHNHFDIASHPGLSELVRGERAVHEVIQRTALDNLWCIAAGVSDAAARQALDKDGLRQLLDRARRDFDYVVIDSCSIREAVDPLYLAQRADATVLSVRTFKSGTTDVERAGERLTQIGTPLLGAVLTDPSGAGCDI